MLGVKRPHVGLVSTDTASVGIYGWIEVPRASLNLAGET